MGNFDTIREMKNLSVGIIIKKPVHNRHKHTLCNRKIGDLVKTLFELAM